MAGSRMRIGVVGGTGTLGQAMVGELTRRGHGAIALSRRPVPGAEVAHRTLDLSTGAGLPRALDGLDTVIDASNAVRGGRAMRDVLVAGTGRLLDAEVAVDVRRHVLISIVGIDELPVAYYRMKLAQERVLAEAPIPTTIVRATQFHALLAGLFAATGRFGVLPGGGTRFQPIDPHEVAAAVTDELEADATRARLTVVGPEILTLSELARTWSAASGGRRLVVPLRLPGPVGRRLRDGALTAPDGAVRGSLTFARWLAEGGSATSG